MVGEFIEIQWVGVNYSKNEVWSFSVKRGPFRVGFEMVLALKRISLGSLVLCEKYFTGKYDVSGKRMDAQSICISSHIALARLANWV